MDILTFIMMIDHNYMNGSERMMVSRKELLMISSFAGVNVKRGGVLHENAMSVHIQNQTCMNYDVRVNYDLMLEIGA